MGSYIIHRSVLGMGDNGGTDVGDRPDNQIEIIAGGPPRSPWKTSAAASLVTGADSESWPALSDAQQRSKCNGGVDLNSANSPPPSMQAESDGCADPPTNSAPVGVSSLLVLSIFCLLFLDYFC